MTNVMLYFCGPFEDTWSNLRFCKGKRRIAINAAREQVEVGEFTFWA
jgi:hypothetical protein